MFPTKNKSALIFTRCIDYSDITQQFNTFKSSLIRNDWHHEGNEKPTQRHPHSKLSNSSVFVPNPSKALLHKPRVWGGLHDYLLQPLELGVRGVGGQAEDEALAGRQEGADVAQPLQGELAIGHGAGAGAVHGDVNLGNAKFVSSFSN